jgi:predicted ATPase
VRGLAQRLDDRFRLLTSGRRTALPRHQTLSATLDWSFELLPVSEKTALRRLGIFAGDFSLTSAAAVTSELGVDRQRAATLAVRDKTKALEHGSAARWGRPRGCRHSCHALPTAALQNRHNRWLGSSLSSGPR